MPLTYGHLGRDQGGAAIASVLQDVEQILGLGDGRRSPSLEAPRGLATLRTVYDPLATDGAHRKRRRNRKPPRGAIKLDGRMGRGPVPVVTPARCYLVMNCRT